MDTDYTKNPEDLKTTEVEDLPQGEASRRHHPMAFTIHFSDATNGAPPRTNRDAMNNYGLKHRRNQSYSCTEENKTAKGEVNAALAVSLSPVPGRKTVISRRAGYHSEGYFSSDQEEELKNKSGFFVKKLKGLEKGLRKTNLAQEKKNMEEHTSQAKLNNSPHLGRHVFGDFHVEEPSLKIRLNDFEHYNSTAPSVDISDLPQVVTQEEWEGSNSDGEIEVQANVFDNVLHIDDEDDVDGNVVDNDLMNDAASETGTYTIDKDVLCTEEEQARQEIDEVVGSSHLPNEESAESSYSLSSYRSGSNWINDWATQVAQHNNHQPVVAGRPPLPSDRHASHGTIHKGSILEKCYTGVVQMDGACDLGSPSAVTHVTSPRQSPDGSSRRSHQRTGPLSPPSRSSPVLLVDQHIDETQSFLRTTESVVTAMQARMSLSLDSGGESDVEASSGYQPMKRGGSLGNHQDLVRRSSAASDGSLRRATSRVAQLEEMNNEASELKNKKTEHPPPQMSLRRARLESEPESSPPSDRKKMMEPLPACVSKLKKSAEPLKPSSPVQPKVAGPNSPKPKSISRTDCGRFSVRTPKTTPQPTTPAKPVAAAAKKGGSKKTGGARSNSTLSSREVEFQNWKRRKSYDPMKAAAEGKKKDAAKKATFSNSMTQSTTTVEELSESLQNPVLRSASFHGTAGLTPTTYISSEEEEEEDSPTSEFPPYLDPVAGSPAKLSGEGTHGGSRVSLHSTASNSSLRGRAKLEALDSLVVAALCGLSNKLRASCCVVLKKLRYLYEEDFDKTEQLSAIIEMLESPTQPGSPQSRSPSKEISGTLKNLKQIESVIKVLDDILFDDEDFEELESDTLQ